MTRTLLSIGHGYSAQAVARILLLEGWNIRGTTRTQAKADTLALSGIQPILWPGTDLSDEIRQARCLLISAAPTAEGDPFLTTYEEVLSETSFDWVGYLSTTGVYGDHGGDWVDETTPTSPTTQRGHFRAAAEQAWLDTGHPVHIFRLAGIYGPGRGPFSKVANGKARRIVKKGQKFSRIHVDDIAQTVVASMAQPNPQSIYNVCDDDPAPPEDVIAYAAELLDLPIPPTEDFETAEMTPMARSFYSENKKVRNDLIKSELGVQLKHPTYKSGLKALLAAR